MRESPRAEHKICTTLGAMTTTSPSCPWCGSANTKHLPNPKQGLTVILLYRCNDCDRMFNPPPEPSKRP